VLSLCVFTGQLETLQDKVMYLMDLLKEVENDAANCCFWDL
jgi:hypothetical protein